MQNLPAKHRFRTLVGMVLRSVARVGLAALAVATLAAPGSAQEPNFGRALALAGDDLLVGQPVNWYGPGVVYDYRRGADGRWTEAALLTAPDSARKDDFGRALALDGNTLVVGAPRKRDGQGVVYVFQRAGGEAAWEVAATLEPPMEGDHREYGAALALRGDDLLVGSPRAQDTGVVYHFSRGGGGWSLQETISPAGGSGVAGFGSALSWSGSQLLVGAPASDELVGGAYAVELGTAGWGEPAALELPRVARVARGGAGSAVLLDGGRAYVGVPGASVVVTASTGEDGSWAAGEVLRPFDAPARARFGSALAASQGDLWVGAPGAQGSNGRVYRYTAGDDGGWSGARRIDPDETAGTSWPLGFGYSLAVTGEDAVVGMPTRDFGEGRVMALSREGNGWRASQMLQGEIYRIGSGLKTGDRCEEGTLSEFPCSNMELVAHVPISDLGGERGVWVNDVWGWTDPETGTNYALVARRDGASFLDLSNLSAPRLVGNLPRTDGSRPSVWRDIKVIGTTAYIVADGAGQHGMQVFDLNRLRGVTGEARLFEPDATYREMASAHNVVADTESGFLYIVGANSGGRTCGGGLHIVDAREPLQPTFAGCYNDPTSANSRGYTHDAQCLVYRGPDEEYRGRQICVGSNEVEINIADVTDKSAPVTVSRMSYPNVAYAHQGWFDEEQRYFYMNDEGDETAGVVERTRTMVWDLVDLDDPQLVKEYLGPVESSDHNLYVVGDLMYQANYGSGLRVLDISDRASPREIAHFDSAPYNDDGPGFSATESGAWSNYPFFEDGLVIFTSVREGLFIMRVNRPIS